MPSLGWMFLILRKPLFFFYFCSELYSNIFSNLVFSNTTWMFHRKGPGSWPSTLCWRVEEPERVSGKFTTLWHPDDVFAVQLERRVGYCQVRWYPKTFGGYAVICTIINPSAILCHRSLLTFVATETGTLSYALLLRYLTLCVKGMHDREVFDVYDIMRESFPSLDTGASTLFIKSFSRTARWREAVHILQEVKKVNSFLLFQKVY